MTAFYMFRVVFLTFWGEFRGWTIGRPSMLAQQEAAHGHADHAHDDDHDHGAHHEEDLTTPGYAPSESPWQMTVPLIILGALAIFAGILNMAPFHFEPMSKWLDPVFEDGIKGAVVMKENAEHLVWPLASGGIIAFLVGTGVAYWMYILRAGEPAKAMAEASPGLYLASLLDKWRIDELYEVTVLAMVDALADTFAAFDMAVVDGILARLSALLVVARPADALSRLPDRRRARLQRVHGDRTRGDGVVLRRPARGRDGELLRRRRLRRPGEPRHGLHLPLGRERRRKSRRPDIR